MSLRKNIKRYERCNITPFYKDLSVDFEALGKVINTTLKWGKCNIVSLGTTGKPVYQQIVHFTESILPVEYRW
jgi:dihydrodipicolinate synthase/N-acetylneuraminate lyase